MVAGFARPDYLEPNGLVVKGPLQDKIQGLMRRPWWKIIFWKWMRGKQAVPLRLHITAHQTYWVQKGAYI